MKIYDAQLVLENVYLAALSCFLYSTIPSIISFSRIIDEITRIKPSINPISSTLPLSREIDQAEARAERKSPGSMREVNA